ncbi:MAG: family 1 glycosylhydrolase [Spirochaetia bacterium]|jgi:beta-glucosidase|nr:family 1 glycosylhydrolase [Spirochaetia bacterium]
MDFPKGFLWGAATSAYQVEGGNRFSDWWEFERRYDSPCEDKCGDSTDHYHRYAADIAMLASFGLNTFRFGIEWARIEPEDGEISYAELQHYRRVLECCKANNVTPIVTFCHHTLPIWVSRKGGWIWKDAPKRFSQYCDLVTAELGDLIPYAMTINQPDLDTNLGYRYGRTYPGFMAIKTMEPDKVAAIVEPHMSQAHILAREAIRKNIPDVKVGLGLAVTDWVFDGTEEELCQQRIVKNCEGHYFALTKGDDYVGVQAYTTNYIPAGHNPDAPVSKHDFPCPPGKKLTAMGYEFAPFAVADCVRRTVSKTGLPVIVTENGVGTFDDSERIEFIDEVVSGLASCIKDGIDLRGYIHWSLIDNFEWNSGYRMRFGLVAVNRKTFVRTPKKSAYHLGEIAKRNAF